MCANKTKREKKTIRITFDNVSFENFNESADGVCWNESCAIAVDDNMRADEGERERGWKG